jgi:hypothetical protein
MEPVELPLFLGREEPIFGRFTARELGLVAGSGLTGLLVIALDWWPLAIALPLVVLLVGLSLVEACLVHQGHRPAWWLAHWLAFGLSPRTWVWQRPVPAASAAPAATRTGAFAAIDPASLEPAWLPASPSPHRAPEVP